MSGRSDSPEQVRAGGRLLGIGISGAQLTAREKEVLAEVLPAAVILFARNVETPEQLHELIASIRATCDPAPVLMIDEEGGRVDRLRSIVSGVPAAADLVDCADTTMAVTLGRAIGALLAEFDIEVNLAPVVDLWREGRSPSLLRRCFGSDPQLVGERAGAFIMGMTEKGVLSCLKHFPGLGLAETDPHHATSVVDLEMSELEAGDLVPYRMLGEASPAVMVGHGIYPKIDSKGLPGTLSPFISQELLRDRIGFGGLAVTDDMEMHAVADVASPSEIAARSVLAGNDLVLFCSRLDEAPEIASTLGRLAEERSTRTRFEDAKARVGAFVRLCSAQALRRRDAKRGLDRVRDEVAGLRSSLDLV
jgi:beta-N-acetylhexosaminidase